MNRRATTGRAEISSTVRAVEGTGNVAVQVRLQEINRT